MASGTIPAPYIEILDLSSSISTVASLSSNDVSCLRFGNLGLFKFRMKASGNFPVSFTKTHELPIHPPVNGTGNYQVLCPKTNANACVLVEVRTTGEVYVYSYGSAYSDWVTGEMWFPIGE